jgi:hypothetical protein
VQRLTRQWNSLLSAFLIAVLSGCAAFKGYPERSTSLATDLRELNDSIAAARITECLGQADNLACRNKFIGARMYATDIRFSEFEEKLFRQTRESGFAATLATLGLTTTAALTTGGASQILSGIAAFIIGGREGFQKEVLAERTVVAIHTAMRARRAQVRLRLRNGLHQSTEQYPLAVALADLNDYYDAGTILGALVGITETVGAEAKQAEERLLELTPLSKVSFESEPTAVRQAMLSKLDTLPQADAIALVTRPPVPINDDMRRQANEIDPSNQRQRNAKVAKAVLKAWLSHSVKVEDYPKWAAAMKVVP